jgi:hypothetical protein
MRLHRECANLLPIFLILHTLGNIFLHWSVSTCISQGERLQERTFISTTLHLIAVNFSGYLEQVCCSAAFQSQSQSRQRAVFLYLSRTVKGVARLFTLFICISAKVPTIIIIASCTPTTTSACRRRFEVRCTRRVGTSQQEVHAYGA